jgi:hypothetical protein
MSRADDCDNKKDNSQDFESNRKTHPRPSHINERLVRPSYTIDSSFADL